MDVRRRGQDFFENFQLILDHAACSKPDLVVHGGDLFFRRRVPPRIVDLAYEVLLKFSANGIPVLIVPGNHEGARLPASLWLAASGTYVFDRPRTFHLVASAHTIAVSGFPFVRHDAGPRFKELLAETGWEDSPARIKLLCLHQAVEGAQFGPANYTFRPGRDVVKVSDIPQDFAAVLTGHIHRRQVLNGARAQGKPPIIYPGSIERTSFAEKDEPKGFYEIELAPDSTGRWRTRGLCFRELPTRPMVDLLIDPPAEQPGLEAHLRERTANLDKNSIVRLRSKKGLGQSALAKLTAPFLRSVFPSSMNVQLAMEFYRRELANPGDD